MYVVVASLTADVNLNSLIWLMVFFNRDVALTHYLFQLFMVISSTGMVLNRITTPDK